MDSRFPIGSAVLFQTGGNNWCTGVITLPRTWEDPKQVYVRHLGSTWRFNPECHHKPNEEVDFPIEWLKPPVLKPNLTDEEYHFDD